MNEIESALNPVLALGAAHRRPRKVCSRGLWLSCLLAFAALSSACSERKVPVEIMGYNHMPDWGIAGFSVNGAGGSNITPESGGGSFDCCISIPRHWKPGMKARVKWTYDTTQGGPTPPPSQEAVVDIPEYTPQNLGQLQAHFYPNHRVLVVVSMYRLGHPLHPLPKADWAPWTLNENWARNLKILQERQGKE